jgi:HAD superfamily hydrolase (TIGR01509 family)
MALDTTRIRAVIFDMDGLIVDSEPCWQKAEIIVFKKVGINLTLEMCQQTTGKPIADVIRYWYEKSPWENPDFNTMKEELIRITEDLIGKEAQLMPGVLDMIHFAKTRQWKTGLASASPMRMIKSILNQFNLIDLFEFYHSAELEKFNKPDPAVYLTVAKTLQTPIVNCLIIEDSGNGVKGAIASGAQVAAVPSSHDFDLEIFNKAQLKVHSLLELKEKIA